MRAAPRPASRPGPAAGHRGPRAPPDLAPRRPQPQPQLRLPALPDQPQLHAVQRPREEPGPGGHPDAVAAHGGRWAPWVRGAVTDTRQIPRPGFVLMPAGQAGA